MDMSNGAFPLKDGSVGGATNSADTVDIVRCMAGAPGLPPQQPYNFIPNEPLVVGDPTAPQKKTGITDRRKRAQEAKLQGELEAKRKLDELAITIQAARAEKEDLIEERSALIKVADYCAATLQATQSLVSGTLSSTMEKVRFEVHNAIDSLMIDSLMISVTTRWTSKPTQAQLATFFNKKNAVEIGVISIRARKKTMELYTRWENEPAAREKIEAKLTILRSIRLRFVTYIITSRPDLLPEIFPKGLMSTGPNGEPNIKLVAAAAEMELTPKQLESFEREWMLYLQKSQLIRQELRSTLSSLASSSEGAKKTEAVACSALSDAEVFLNRLETVHELATHPQNEVQATGKIFLWLQSELSFKQEAALIRHCMPFYPDAIQFGRVIFGDGNKLEQQAQSA